MIDGAVRVIENQVWRLRARCVVQGRAVVRAVAGTLRCMEDSHMKPFDRRGVARG